MSRATETDQTHVSTAARSGTFLHTYRINLLVIAIPLFVSLVFAAMYLPKHEADLTSQERKAANASATTPLNQPTPSTATSRESATTPSAGQSENGQSQSAPNPTASTPSHLQGSASSSVTANPQTAATPVPITSPLTPLPSPICQTIPKIESQLNSVVPLVGATLSGTANALGVPKCLY
jgi:cytoskeletal protein RodZ